MANSANAGIILKTQAGAKSIGPLPSAIATKAAPPAAAATGVAPPPTAAPPVSGYGAGLASKTITVSNATQLAAAIKLATGGETINLNPGNYGGLMFYKFAPTSMVTIQSATATKAVVSGIISTISQNLTFSNLEVTQTIKSSAENALSMIRVSESHNINLLNLDVHGSLNHNPIDDLCGLRVSGSSDIQIDNSTFHDLYIAAGFSGVKALAITNNTIFEVREAMDFAGIHHALIDHNLVHSVIPNYMSDPSIILSPDPATNAGDHADMIQFWTVNAGPSDDVTISNNALLMGHGIDAHGIFMNAQNGDKYSNFLIQNNLVSVNNAHGITVADMNDSIIDKNTILTAAGSTYTTGFNIYTSSNLQLTDNISTYYNIKDSNIKSTGNIKPHVGGAMDATNVLSMFTNPLKLATISVDDFTEKAGGLAATSGAGFDLVKYKTPVAFATYDAMTHALDAGAFLHHIA